MQCRIRALLDELYRPSSRAHGFIKGRSVRTNAVPHVGKRLILNVDIQDFFETVTFPRVRGRLMAPPYDIPNAVATAIARLCTVNGSLPIGAPSSPVLANMICSRRTGPARLARDMGCFYTRYADDITISTERNRFPNALVELAAGQRSGAATAGDELQEIIRSNGFEELNPAKTCVLSRSDSQQVCGIVCNERMNVRRNLRCDILRMIHAWRKFGYIAAAQVWDQEHNWRRANSFERSVRGKLAFLIHVRGEDDVVVNSLVEQFNALPGRTFRPISYPFRGGWKDQLHKTVCVIESGDDEPLLNTSKDRDFSLETALC